MNPIADCRITTTAWNQPLAEVNNAKIEPPAEPSSSAGVIKAKSGRRQNLFELIFCRRPPASPVARLRRRSFLYYLRRAKEPAVGQRRKSKTGFPPRPSGVADLHRFCRDLKVGLVALAMSATFIACYCLWPAVRPALGPYEPLACSAAVVMLLFSALGILASSVEILRIRRAARHYADCVIATVDEKGHFAVKPGDDSDYAEYLEAYGPDSIVFAQREYYEWMVNSNAPVRKVARDYYGVSKE